MQDYEDRRTAEERMKSEERLPPGQSLTLKFPILHYGPTPLYPDLKNWSFRVYGLVEEEVTWTWEEFMELPRRSTTLDIHCVTRWSKFDTRWEGVHVKDLIDQGYIKLKPEARYVIQHCEYGYTTNTSLDVILDDNFLLATHFDGQPLDAEHGYPLRGLIGAVPGRKAETDRYLWKGGKWLRGLEFTEKDRPGFWEVNGYSNNAQIWREERYWGSGGL